MLDSVCLCMEILVFGNLNTITFSLISFTAITLLFQDVNPPVEPFISTISASISPQ